MLSTKEVDSLPFRMHLTATASELAAYEESRSRGDNHHTKNND